MINAQQTPTDDIKNYLHVAAEEKREGRLRPAALKPTVLALYETYLDRVTDEDGPAVDLSISEFDQKELVKNARYLGLVYFKKLRIGILSSTPSKRCPYCYQVKASQVDHYLPKAQFGEYTVYSPNLVPICNICNGKKLNKFVRPGGGRRFLHPYFDRLPDGPVRYLTARVSIRQSVLINFEVVQPAQMSDELWSVHLNQFTELDLALRYTDDAIDTVNGMLLSLRHNFSIGGGAKVAEELRIEQASRTYLYGPNHWWPVTLEALAASAAFCDGGFNVLDPIRAVVV
ncbi:HNH endonuclease [Rhodococcus sp. BP22]|uniref:HNH endonuclease n=1 Tax=Rhodococcus sp. BP22 TaxID=2758566 RepID=UPI0016459BBB|nr:HNH endonuclease [Rhodococcus sp. BP22]